MFSLALRLLIYLRHRVSIQRVLVRIHYGHEVVLLQSRGWLTIFCNFAVVGDSGWLLIDVVYRHVRRLVFPLVFSAFARKNGICRSRLDPALFPTLQEGRYFLFASILSFITNSVMSRLLRLRDR